MLASIDEYETMDHTQYFSFRRQMVRFSIVFKNQQKEKNLGRLIFYALAHKISKASMDLLR
jgi:hypothetical protein